MRVPLLTVGKTIFYALCVVEVDASSQGIQTLYRKGMQEHGTFGKMMKPTNCAKYLMIEQPTICSNNFYQFRSAPVPPTWLHKKIESRLTIHHKLSSKYIFQKCILVLPRTKLKVHTGSNIRLASPAIWHSGSIHSYKIIYDRIAVHRTCHV